MAMGYRGSQRTGPQEPPRAGVQRVTVYGCGRVCAEPECETVLSAYNPSAYCWLHERRALAAKVRSPRNEARPVRKACAHDACTRAFQSANPARRYCSDRCRMAAFQSRRSMARSPGAGGPSSLPESV